MTETPEAFFIEDASGFVPTDATLGPWGPGLLHGGAVAALCATVMERESDPELLSLRLTVELLRPPIQEPIEARVNTVRTGRRADVKAAELWTDGKLVAKATLLRIRPIDVKPPPNMLAQASSAPDVRSDYAPYDIGPNPTGAQIIGTGVDMRVREQRPMPGTGVVWMRLLIPIVSGTTSSTMERVAMCADFGNGLSGPPTESWPPPLTFMNADLDVRLLRDADEDWIRIDPMSFWTEEGIGVTRTELHDVQGILAHAQQSLVLQPT